MLKNDFDSYAKRSLINSFITFDMTISVIKILITSPLLLYFVSQINGEGKKKSMKNS